MSTARALLLRCSLILVAQATLFAQAAGSPFDKLPAPQRKLIAITVAGSKRFGQDAIIAASGLQTGITATEDDFKKAARHLADTGAFSNIEYKYSYSGAGTKLDLQVIDAHDFVPARFEDFVWIPDAELRQQIKEHVPLFDGQLPTSGNLPEQVSDVLQALLVQRGIPGHVDLLRVGKEDAPVEAISYRVSDVLIRVRKIEFIGAGAAELPALEAAAQGLSGIAYSRGRLDQFVQRELLPIYRSHGYLKAQFSGPQPIPVKLPSAEDIAEGPRNQSIVDVRFNVTPGIQYKLASLNWSGNHELASEQLRDMVHVELGQPADLVRLESQIKGIQRLYSSRGFISASLKANAQFDDPGATVAVMIEVKEGAVFHMGDLEFRGLDNSLTAKLRDAWKLRSGDVYDANYLDEYLPAAEKLLPSGFDWQVSPHITPNVRDKTVDIDLIYSVKVPK